jgi:hypothetical protein
LHGLDLPENLLRYPRWLKEPEKWVNSIVNVVIVSQGDQIGRIFATWAIVFFGQFLWKLQDEPKFVGYYFPRKKACINFYKAQIFGLLFSKGKGVYYVTFTNNGFGYTSGDFFTKSSGRPVGSQSYDCE